MDDNQISKMLQMARMGDKVAFKELVNSYSGYAFKIAFRMLVHEEDAKDVVQETFIRVWKNMKGYKQEIKFTTWMYKIVTNLCLDLLKQRKRRRENQDNNEVFSQIDARNIDEGRQHDLNDLATILKRLTEKLTPKQKVVFVLHFLEEKSLDEIAEITGFSKGNIKSNVYYARKNMQGMLQNVMAYNLLNE